MKTGKQISENQHKQRDLCGKSKR